MMSLWKTVKRTFAAVECTTTSNSASAFETKRQKTQHCVENAPNNDRKDASATTTVPMSLPDITLAEPSLRGLGDIFPRRGRDGDQLSLQERAFAARDSRLGRDRRDGDSSQERAFDARDSRLGRDRRDGDSSQERALDARDHAVGSTNPLSMQQPSSGSLRGLASPTPPVVTTASFMTINSKGCHRLSVDDEERHANHVLKEGVSESDIRLGGFKSENWWARQRAESLQGELEPALTGFGPETFSFLVDMAKYYRTNNIIGRGEASNCRGLTEQGLGALLEVLVNFNSWSSNLRATAGDDQAGTSDASSLRVPQNLAQRFSYPILYAWMDYPNGRVADTPNDKASAFVGRLGKIQQVVRYIYYCNDLRYDGSPLQRRLHGDIEVLSSKKALYTASFARRAELAGRIPPMELLINVTSDLTANLETRLKAHMTSTAPSTAQSRVAQSRVFAAEICLYLGSAFVVNAHAVPRAGALAYMDVNDNFRPVLGPDGKIQHYACDYVSGMLKGRSTRGPGPAPLRFHHSLNWLISVYLSTYRLLLVGTTVGLQNKGPLLLQPNLERINSAWLRKSWRRFMTPFLPEEAKTMTPHHARHAQTEALNRIYPSPSVRAVAQAEMSFDMNHTLKVATLHYDLSDTSKEVQAAANEKIELLHLASAAQRARPQSIGTTDFSVSSSAPASGALGQISDDSSSEEEGDLDYLDGLDLDGDLFPEDSFRMKEPILVSGLPLRRLQVMPAGALGAFPFSVPPPPPPPPQGSSPPSYGALYQLPFLPRANSLSAPGPLYHPEPGLPPNSWGLNSLDAPGITTFGVGVSVAPLKAVVHGAKVRPLPASESPCNTCHKTFQSLAGLKSHEKMCGRKHADFLAARANHEPVCTLCLRTFQGDGRLRQHLLTCSRRKAVTPVSSMLLLMDSAPSAS